MANIHQWQCVCQHLLSRIPWHSSFIITCCCFLVCKFGNKLFPSETFCWQDGLQCGRKLAKYGFSVRGFTEVGLSVTVLCVTCMSVTGFGVPCLSVVGLIFKSLSVRSLSVIGLSVTFLNVTILNVTCLSVTGFSQDLFRPWVFDHECRLFKNHQRSKYILSTSRFYRAFLSISLEIHIKGQRRSKCITLNLLGYGRCQG